MLRWYEGLEAQVMDFIRVVPPHGCNLEVWSPRLATVLVDTCCLIKSIFYQFKDDAATEQPNKRNPGARPNLGDYAELYSSLLSLSKRTAILLTDTPEYCKPFGLWSDLLDGQQFPESDETQSSPRSPDGFFVNRHATILRSWEHGGVFMRGGHVNCCSQSTPGSRRRCAFRLGSKWLGRPLGFPPERDGPFVNRCAHVGVRHVFPQIACPPCF